MLMTKVSTNDVRNRIDGYFHYFLFAVAFVKLPKATTCFVMSVCPHGTTRLSLDRFF